LRAQKQELSVKMREKIRERFAFERNLETHRTESENFSLSALFSHSLYTFQGVEPRHRQKNLQANPFDESLKQQGENNTQP